MRRFAAALALLGLAACAQPGHPPGQRPAASPDTVDGGAQRPKITAQQLLGKDDAWVRDKMGEPAFMRADRVANIWQYKNTACVLNVFLYADDAQSAAPKRVLHFDARDATGRNTDRDQCLSTLQD